jgi:hypothetical protein
MAEDNFSTLEVVQQGYEPFRNEKSAPIVEGKQLVVTEETGKHVVPVVPYSDHDAPGLEATPVQYYPIEQQYQDLPVYQKQNIRRSRKWLWIGGVGLLVVILAAVLGGVLGSRKSKSSSTAPTSVSNTTTASTTPQQRHIAAAAFVSNKINNTRVYYQTDDGTLIEAANSASNTTWGFTSIANLEKTDSNLAAAVSRPGFPLVSLPLDWELSNKQQEINVFYTDENYLIHNYLYNSTTNKWAEGAVSKQNYITHPNSSLTAMYNQCRYCANTTIMAYQDINGFVQFANLTSSGWTLTQLSLDSYTGTGLALQPFYRTGIADQINLYYQTTTLNITLASLDPRLANTGGKFHILISKLY